MGQSVPKLEGVQGVGMDTQKKKLPALRKISPVRAEPPCSLLLELAGQVLTARIRQEIDTFRAAGGWEGGGRDKVRRAWRSYACCGRTGGTVLGALLGGEYDHGLRLRRQYDSRNSCNTSLLLQSQTLSHPLDPHRLY